MNSVNLIGRLTRDPELRRTDGGTAVCTMRLAVNGIREGEVTYVDVVAFEKQAEACASHLGKGRQIAVSGRLSYSEWETDAGEKRSRHEVIGRVQFLGSGRRPEANGGEGSEPAALAASAESDEDIAF